jgi:hypothetical protein
MTAVSLALLAALLGEPSAAPAAEALPPVPLVAAFSLLESPEGSEVPLRRDGESQVSPASRFRVVAGAPLSDGRLALYDAQEALVPAEEKAEIGSAMSRYTLIPARPLHPGSRYTLRLEGASGREMRDLADRRYRPISFAIATSGAPRRDAPTRKRAKRGRAPG